MSPVLEQNQNTFNTLPGPVDRIICQAGQIIVIDPTTKPATTTSLAPDDVYEAEGKAGLGIADIEGSRFFVQGSLENRTDDQTVVPPDAQPQVDPHGGDDVSEAQEHPAPVSDDLEGATTKEEIKSKLRGE